jgi:CxxC motif-containing protein (DUF1111 family)
VTIQKVLLLEPQCCQDFFIITLKFFTNCAEGKKEMRSTLIHFREANRMPSLNYGTTLQDLAVTARRNRFTTVVLLKEGVVLIGNNW